MYFLDLNIVLLGLKMVIFFLKFDIFSESLFTFLMQKLHFDLTQVRQFLKKESAKIMQKDSKVNKLFCLFTKKPRAKIFQPQKLTPN